MSLSTNDRKTAITASALQTVFTADFPLFAVDEVRVEQTTTADPPITTTVDPADYTINYTTPGVFPTNFTITMDTGVTVNYIITIYGERPVRSVSAFSTGGDFTADNVNRRIDEAAAERQEINRKTDLALHIADHLEETVDTLLPDPEALKYLQWKEDLSGLQNALPTGNLGGLGTENYIPMWSDTETLTDSVMVQVSALGVSYVNVLGGIRSQGRIVTRIADGYIPIEALYPDDAATDDIVYFDGTDWAPGTITSLLLADGSAGAPSLAAANFPTTGRYWAAGPIIGEAIDGVTVSTLSEDGLDIEGYTISNNFIARNLSAAADTRYTVFRNGTIGGGIYPLEDDLSTLGEPILSWARTGVDVAYAVMSQPLVINRPSAPADSRSWWLYHTDTTLNWAVATDALVGDDFMVVTRSGGTATNVTFPKAVTMNGALLMSASAPTQLWYESDQAVNSRYWGVAPIAGVMTYRVLNDALNVATPWMQVTRSGTTVTDIALTATTITLNGSVSLGGGGIIAMSAGGTGKNLTAANGGIVYSDADSFEILAAGSSGQILRSGGAGAPAWSTPTWPNTATSGKILRGDGTNWIESTPTFPNTAASASYLRGDGTNWIESTLKLPNSATVNRVPYANATNQWADAAGFEFNGTTFTAPALDVTNQATFNGVVLLTGTAPTHLFYESDQSAGSRYWGFTPIAGVLTGRVMDDGLSSAANWLEVTRSGTAISDVELIGTTITLTGAPTVSGAATLNGPIATPNSAITIAAGAVTATRSYHRIDTEAAAATDELDTINGGADGMHLYIRTVTSARDVTVRHIGGGTGNIRNSSAADIVLTTSIRTLHYIYDGALALWLQVGDS